MKIKLPIKTIISPEFQRAFKALGSDPIPVTARFRIAQTFPIILAAIAAYEEARTALLKEKGEPESVVLKRKQDARKDAPIKTPDDAYIAKRLAEIEAGAEDRMAIDNSNAEKLQSFTREHDALLNEEIETALTAKVKLSPESRLTAQEIAALLDVVEIEEAATEKE